MTDPTSHDATARALADAHPAWMIATLIACGVVLRLGLRLRHARRFRRPRPKSLRAQHARLAKPAVVAVLIGLLAGPISSVWLRDWAFLGTFHGVVGLVSAALFVAAAVLGRRIERRHGFPLDAHALLGLLAMLSGVIAAVAGFVLLP